MQAPVSVHLEVTHSCNNRCPHCYASTWLDSTRADHGRILEIASRIAAADVFDVIITGGEPLMVGADLLGELMTLFRSNEIECSLNTNGRLLTPATCRILREQGLKSVLVSLHSWDDALHDEIVGARHAGKQTKAGIRNALEQGLRVFVNQVVDCRNIDTLVASGKELEKMGVHGVALTRALSPLDSTYVVKVVDAARFLDAYIECSKQLTVPVSSLLPIPYCADPRVLGLPGNRACSGGFSTAVVSCDGEVRFCPHDTHVWGNLLEEDLPAIWRRIMEWRVSMMVPEECTTCVFLPDCGGGCRVASKLSGNDYAGKDPWARQAATNYRRTVVLEEFEPDAPHRLLKDVRWRKEGECFLLYRESRYFAVDADGLELIQRLPEHFVPGRLLTSPSHIDFLSEVYHQGLLVRTSDCT